LQVEAVAGTPNPALLLHIMARVVEALAGIGREHCLQWVLEITR
jgi:hypothetical protein